MDFTFHFSRSATCKNSEKSDLPWKRKKKQRTEAKLEGWTITLIVSEIIGKTQKKEEEEQSDTKKIFKTPIF